MPQIYKRRQNTQHPSQFKRSLRSKHRRYTNSMINFLKKNQSVQHEKHRNTCNYCNRTVNNVLFFNISLNCFLFVQKKRKRKNVTYAHYCRCKLRTIVKNQMYYWSINKRNI